VRVLPRLPSTGGSLGIHFNGGGQNLPAEENIAFVAGQRFEVEFYRLSDVRHSLFQRIPLRLASLQVLPDMVREEASGVIPSDGTYRPPPEKRPSSSRQFLDAERFPILLGVPEVILNLLVKPAFRSGVEGHRETDRHLRADA